MRAKLETLKRITKLYEAVEEAHSAELTRAAAALGEVRNAVDAERMSAGNAFYEGREAMASGDRVGWMAADSQRRAAGAKLGRLAAVHAERKRSSDVAREQYVASRRKSEQMQRLAAGAAEQVTVHEEKKVQAATDDRFLARQRWVNASSTRGGPRRMKAF